MKPSFWDEPDPCRWERLLHISFWAVIIVPISDLKFERYPSEMIQTPISPLNNNELSIHL